MNMKEPGYDVKYFGVGAPAVSSVKPANKNQAFICRLFYAE
jgi:hypothetical protein